nr:TetR/AcrR family transcriptional regulator [uncultured Cohaesibacter sp.]
MTTKTEKTRDHILTVGRRLMSELGFNALGLGLLLKEADIPKGSFYYYFASKEDFGCKLLEQYIAYYHERLDALWSREDRSGRQQLMDYWDQWVVTQCPVNAENTCLIVKLGAEVSDMSEDMRTILANGATSIVARLSAQIRKGQKDASLSLDIKADETAAMLYQMWLGASLVAKLEHAAGPLVQARANSEALLPAPSTANQNQ